MLFTEKTGGIVNAVGYFHNPDFIVGSRYCFLIYSGRIDSYSAAGGNYCSNNQNNQN